MKKLTFFLTLVTVFATAQEPAPPAALKPWKHQFQTGLNINQAEFSDNWKGGGVNSLAYGWFLNYLANYSSNKTTINSDLQLQLGYLQNKGQDTRKTADRIFYDIKIGYKIAPKWDVFGSLNLLSQFAQGFDYAKKDAAGKDSLVSNIFAPAYITSSVGLEYKPISYLWMRFGVGTLRQTLVLDSRISDAGLYGLERKGDQLRNQAVLQYIANFDKDLAKNINLKARYSLNWDYFKAGKTNQFVHLFNANLTMKATKYISTNIQLNVINDYDMDKKTQWSQILSLGILYNITREAVRNN